MKCYKCGTEFNNQPFCPRCGCAAAPNTILVQGSKSNNPNPNTNNKKVLIITSIIIVIAIIITSISCAVYFYAKSKNLETNKSDVVVDVDIYQDDSKKDNEDEDDFDVVEDEEETTSKKQITKQTTTLSSYTKSGEQLHMQPFYGIMCSAYKSKNDAHRDAKVLRDNGFSDAEVFRTTDWENLNDEEWYVVSAVICDTKEQADSQLNKVKKYHSDAYVKYSGAYLNAYFSNHYNANDPNVKHSDSEFFGILCSAYTNESDAKKDVKKLNEYGYYQAQIFVTNEWENFNSKKYYIVCAGVYNSKYEAEEQIDDTHTLFKDAYIKSSGNYKY